MYWNKREDSSKPLEVELLEARGSTSFLVERREEESVREEEEEEEKEKEEEEKNQEGEEQVTTKKRSSCTRSNQLRKKQSISNINHLTLENSNHSSELQTFVSEEEIQVDHNNITMAAAFNHNETWNRIKQLTVTSKHYTARDKNELIAQEPTFTALDDLIAFSATITDQAKKNRIDHMVNNAISQLKLYYFVGTEGWTTAIATIKSSEAARLGLLEPMI